VTAGLIGLLTAIMAPGLKTARRQARELACAVNLRSWGQAFSTYAAGSSGFLPHTDDRTRNRPAYVYDSRYPEHECGYIDVLPPLLDRPAWRDIPDGVKPRGDVWQCPDAAPLPDSAYTPRFKPSVKGYHSYAMNSYLEYDFPYGQPAGAEPAPNFLPLNRCKAPARTILLFEQTLNPAQGYGQQGGHPEAGWHTGEDARALAERHYHLRGGLGGNIVMLDGHREWRGDLWNEALGNPRLPPRGDLTWFPY
jgi:hypothetical protein